MSAYNKPNDFFVIDFFACMTKFVERINNDYFIRQRGSQSPPIEACYECIINEEFDFFIKFNIPEDELNYLKKIKIGSYSKGDDYFRMCRYLFLYFEHSTPEHILFNAIKQESNEIISSINHLIKMQDGERKPVSVEEVLAKTMDVEQKND